MLNRIKLRYKMKKESQISTLLSICIIPQIIDEIKEFYDNEDEVAIKEFYKSNLFDKLQNPDTGLWHLSAKSLAQMFLLEVKEQIIEFPEEQS